MNYIIEKANFISDSGIAIRSFLVEKSKVVHYGATLKKYQAVRMDVSSFFMTPGYVFCDFSLSHAANLQAFKLHQQNLIKKGCTTVIVPWDIKYESEFERKIKQARHAMINSTLDYCLGIHIPLEKLTPNIVRLCKKNLIPFIVASVPEDHNIYSVPWGWIRDAAYQYKIPIYPIWKGKDEKALAQQKETWELVTSANRIPTVLHFPTESTPLSKIILKHIGLYPNKGDLLIGNDLDYNLFCFGDDQLQVEQSEKLGYDKIKPSITVHKGRLLRAEEEINFYPGFGNELIIKIPGLFATIETIS